MRACALARFNPMPCIYRADGRPDPCHWIPQQRLKAEYQRRGYPEKVIDLAIADPRVIVEGCRRHHDQLDGRDAMNKLVLARTDYPRGLHEYAREFCWWFAGPRAGWVPDRLRLEDGPLPGLLVDFEPVDLSVSKRIIRGGER